MEDISGENDVPQESAISGFSPADAKTFACALFANNFLKLGGEAEMEALRHAEAVTDKVLSRIMERQPEALAELLRPAMQHALFSAQEGCALSGDPDLGGLLAELVAERVRHPQRNFLQIVVDEALRVAPRLLPEHLDAISLSFVLTQTRRTELESFADFRDYLLKVVSPIAAGISTDAACYDHIEYAGCGRFLPEPNGDLEAIIRNNYRWMFSTGFSEQQLAAVGSPDAYRDLVTPCFHDRQKLQFSARDDRSLAEQLRDAGRPEEEAGRALELMERTTMHPFRVRNEIVAIDRAMEKVFDAWTSTPLKRLQLTDVGIAVAHAEYRRRTGEILDLEMWIG